MTMHAEKNVRLMANLTVLIDYAVRNVKVTKSIYTTRVPLGLRIRTLKFRVVLTIALTKVCLVAVRADRALSCRIVRMLRSI